MLITKTGFCVIIFLAFWSGYLIAYYSIIKHLTGTILIDRSKPVDIYRIELDKELNGKYSIFINKYVNNLESANETPFLMKKED